jgi:ribonuclease P protein component
VGIPSNIRIKKNTDYQTVFKKGKQISGRGVILYYSKNSAQDTRVGIIVSKKVGNAVVRNRIKRIIREIFRLNWPDIKSGYDIIIITRKSIREKSFHDIEKTFIDIMRRAGLLIKNEDNSGKVN